ncbi:hypothetical protein [Legionella sp. km772]|uniref:hypothetical protein n=1 Tax=Legionella sp. km772 TaxID=2498111 RepID=UPI000F8C9C27|nr:hypothetical protein [Legionella sp. km772]RUR08331.1 hypothetical protein ELY15_11250 [Legionella sp. km772]
MHPDSQNMEKFCNKSEAAIAEAKPHLQKHKATDSGWKVLDKIIDWFKSVLSKTASEKVADEMSVEINKTLSK